MNQNSGYSINFTSNQERISQNTNQNSIYSRKVQKFQKQIRREKIIKKFQLYRNNIDISSDKQLNLKLFMDNFQVLRQSTQQDDVANSLKVLKKLLQKYDFSPFQYFKSTQILHRMCFNTYQSDFIIETSLQILQITSQRKIQLISFQLINFDLLKTEKYEIIIKILNICYQLLVRANSYKQFLQYLINQKKITQTLTQLIINNSKSKQQKYTYPKFEQTLIKFTSCFIFYTQDLQMRTFVNRSYKYGEKDYEFVKNQCLKIVCQSFKNKKQYKRYSLNPELQNQTIQSQEEELDDDLIGSLRLFVNYGMPIEFEVIQKLEDIFLYILNNNLKNYELTEGVCRFFNTLTFRSDFCLSSHIVEDLLKFIFLWKNQIWLKKQQSDEDLCIIKLTLSILGNNFTNSQIIPPNFFKYISDPSSQKYPKTCRFTSLFKYLTETSQLGLRYLMKIFGEVIVISGQLGIFAQCIEIIANNQCGAMTLKELGFECQIYMQKLDQIVYDQLRELDKQFDVNFQ